jgi:hypothetical protein
MCSAGAMIAIAFVHNLLRRHPACTVLLHRPTPVAARSSDASTAAAEPDQLANGKPDVSQQASEQPGAQSQPVSQGTEKAKKWGRKGAEESGEAGTVQQDGGKHERVTEQSAWHAEANGWGTADRSQHPVSAAAAEADAQETSDLKAAALQQVIRLCCCPCCRS